MNEPLSSLLAAFPPEALLLPQVQAGFPQFQVGLEPSPVLEHLPTAGALLAVAFALGFDVVVGHPLEPSVAGLDFELALDFGNQFVVRLLHSMEGLLRE